MYPYNAYIIKDEAERREVRSVNKESTWEMVSAPGCNLWCNKEPAGVQSTLCGAEQGLICLYIYTHSHVCVHICGYVYTYVNKGTWDREKWKKSRSGRELGR